MPVNVANSVPALCVLAASTVRCLLSSAGILQSSADDALATARSLYTAVGQPSPTVRTVATGEDGRHDFAPQLQKEGERE